MVEYMVRYTLNNDVYEARVRAASSGSAMRWVETNYPAAVNISVVV